MSKRRETVQYRCPQCKINRQWCFCTELKQIELKVPTTVIKHVRERKLSSNTVTLSKLVLPKIKIIEHGAIGSTSTQYAPAPSEQPLYLYPSAEAITLKEAKTIYKDKKLALVIPDGSWRQTKKFHRRIAGLQDIPHVKISDPPKSQYALRTQKDPWALCTLEAMAYAFKELGDEHSCEVLLDALILHNERGLMARAKLSPK